MLWRQLLRLLPLNGVCSLVLPIPRVQCGVSNAGGVSSVRVSGQRGHSVALEKGISTTLIVITVLLSHCMIHFVS